MMTPIFIASDHAGFNLKGQIIAHLQAQNMSVTDLGPENNQSVDYPDFGYRLAAALRNSPEARGIAICGSGIGISIAANRYHWVRAALVHDVTNARLARAHNDANVIALGERVTGIVQALDCVDAFLSSPFEGGRHQKRIDKLTHPQIED